jgi:hypothetical protein
VTMGCLGWQFNSYQLEPTLGANGEVTRWRIKAVELVLVRPNQAELPPTSASSGWLTCGPWWLLSVAWVYLKSVACPGGPFDTCEA